MSNRLKGVPELSESIDSDGPYNRSFFFKVINRFSKLQLANIFLNERRLKSKLNSHNIIRTSS